MTVQQSPFSEVARIQQQVEPHHQERSWSAVENELKLLIGKDGDARLRLLRSLHDAGLSSNVLLSLTRLAVGPTYECDKQQREMDVEELASFLSDSDFPRSTKLAVLRVLVALRSPLEVLKWQLEDRIISDSLDFIICRDSQWRYGRRHSEEVLFCELRAKAQFLVANSAFRRVLNETDVDTIRKASPLVRGGDAAVDAISSTAKWLTFGLNVSVPIINSGIEVAGDKVKSVLTPHQRPLVPRKTGKVAAKCADAARRATDGVRETAKKTVIGIRDFSTEGINLAAQKFEERGLGERLVPNEESRALLATAGRVGVATVGAVAVVGEAMFESTKSVAQKASAVTADVVTYKYGEDAGKVVQDTADTAGNVLRTVAHVASLERRVLAKVVAKNTAKVNEKERLGDAYNTAPIDPKLLVDSMKFEALHAVRKLQAANPKLLAAAARPKRRSTKGSDSSTVSDNTATTVTSTTVDDSSILEVASESSTGASATDSYFKDMVTRQEANNAIEREAGEKGNQLGVKTEKKDDMKDDRSSSGGLVILSQENLGHLDVTAKRQLKQETPSSDDDTSSVSGVVNATNTMDVTYLKGLNCLCIGSE